MMSATISLNLLKRLAADRQGGPATEFALALPLLMLLFFSFAEAGRYIDHVHVVAKAVRDGVRFAGRQTFGDLSCAPGGGGLDATTAANIRRFVRTGSLAGTQGRTSYWTSDATVTVELTCEPWNSGIYEELEGGAPVVEVSADVPYDPIFGDLGGVLGLWVRASAQTPVGGG